MAKTKTTVLNLRDPETKAAFQKSVKALFKGKAPKKAREIQEAVGGDMNQVRKTLNDLIEEGFLTYEGQTRATTYSKAA
jgi:predicted transcriptional regulator